MIKHIAEHEFEMFVLQSRKKVVLVDFWAQWCAPCRTMDPILESIARRFTMTLDVIKVNVDDEPRLAKVSGVKSIPTMIFFKNGKPVMDQILIGTKTEGELTGIVNTLVSN